MLTPARQHDLLELLQFIAARLAHSDERELRPNQAALSRAMTHIRARGKIVDLLGLVETDRLPLATPPSTHPATFPGLH